MPQFRYPPFTFPVQSYIIEIRTILYITHDMQEQQGSRDKLRKIAKAYNDHLKVPIKLESSNKKIKLAKPLIFVIDPTASFLYFTNTIHKKLEYMGAIKNEQLFFESQGNILTNSYTNMGDIFDKFKTTEGWLQLRIQGDNVF